MDIRNNDNMDVFFFMLVADFGDFATMRELLLEPKLLDLACEYLKARKPQYTHETGGKQLKVIDTDSSSSTLTAQVYKLCSRMRETTCIFTDLCMRLTDVENQLSKRKKIARRKPMERFIQILELTQS